jgi:arylformamidase
VSSPWIDISIPLHSGMVAWPGDDPFKRIRTLRITQGDHCNLSKLSMSAHTGTHMDGPKHFLDGADGIDSMPIDATVGPARVIEIRDPERIAIAELEPHRPAKDERLLFKTRNSTDLWKAREFQANYVYIPADTARYLAESGVRTVGVDYLSVGANGDDGDETHRILLGAGIWIIEGLNLEQVDPGDYELVCLPLKIVGGDGAPARAAVRKLSGR